MLAFFFRAVVIVACIQAAILLGIVKCAAASATLVASEHDRPQWLEQASFTHGDTLYAIGIGTARTIPQARQQAYEHGLQEITNYSGLPVPDGVAISTERLYEIIGTDLVTTYRLMRVDMSSLRTSPAASLSGSETPSTPPRIASQQARTPSQQPRMASQEIHGNTRGDTREERETAPRRLPRATLLTRPLPDEPSECAPTDADCHEWLKLTAERLQRDREASQVIRDEIAYGRLELSRRVLREIVTASKNPF